jgi:hypothetical protein
MSNPNNNNPNALLWRHLLLRFASWPAGTHEVLLDNTFVGEAESCGYQEVSHALDGEEHGTERMLGEKQEHVKGHLFSDDRQLHVE